MLVGLDIRLSRKPGESLLVDIEAKRADSAEQNVNSKVEFKAVNQKRTSDVLLDDIVASVSHFFNFLGQKYSPPLAICFWLDDKSSFLVVKLLAKFAELGRQQPCFGEEVIMLGCSAVHIHEAEPKEIFPREHVNAREMAHLLVQLKLYQEIRLNMMVSP